MILSRVTCRLSCSIGKDSMNCKMRELYIQQNALQMNGIKSSTHGWEFDMTIRIEYPADGPISTQQMLNLGYRLFNETVGPLAVRLVRVAQNTAVHIVLYRGLDNKITESINIEETGG